MSYKKYDYKGKVRTKSGSHHKEEKTKEPYRSPNNVRKSKKFKGLVPMLKGVFKAPSSGKTMVGALVVILLIIVYVFGIRKNAYAVYFGDMLVGNVNYKNVTAEDIVSTTAGLIKSNKGYEVQFDKAITIKHVHASYNKIVEKDQLLTLLQESATYKIQGRELSIMGTPVFVMANEAAINQVLKSIQDDFDVDGVTYIHKGFMEKTDITTRLVAEADLTSNVAALDILKRSVTYEDTYTVVDGDNPSKIAQKNGMTLANLRELNPWYTDGATLREGDVFKVATSKPLLTVVTISTQTYKEPIPKGTPVYENDDTIMAGIKTIKQKGEDGEKEVTIEITWENGVEISREVVDEKIIKQPVEEIILMGTRTRG